MLYQNINNNSKIKPSQLYLGGTDLKGGEGMDLYLGRNNDNNGLIFVKTRLYRIVSPEINRVSERSGISVLHGNTHDTVLIAGSPGAQSHTETIISNRGYV